MLSSCAEMRLPGRAWLEFSVAAKNGGSEITQTAMFDPVGLFGLGNWYAIWPLHKLVHLYRHAEAHRGSGKTAQRIQRGQSGTGV